LGGPFGAIDASIGCYRLRFSPGDSATAAIQGCLIAFRVEEPGSLKCKLFIVRDARSTLKDGKAARISAGRRRHEMSSNTARTISFLALQSKCLQWHTISSQDLTIKISRVSLGVCSLRPSTSKQPCQASQTPPKSRRPHRITASHLHPPSS
jgi:hypothetical protein